MIGALVVKGIVTFLSICTLALNTATGLSLPVASATGLSNVMTSVIATEGATTTVIDSSLIGELLDLCKQVMGLFTEFPLNVFLIVSFIGIGFGIFRKAKRAAK